MEDSTNFYTPGNSNQYQGAQVIINSDRLTFNAKKDSVLLYSNKDIGFSAQGSIYFDTSETKTGTNSSKFIINSPEIYLGLQDGSSGNPDDRGKLPVERAVLGNELRRFLFVLLDFLVDIIDDLEDGSFSTISSEPGKATIGNAIANSGIGKIRKDQIELLKKQIAVDKVGQYVDAVNEEVQFEMLSNPDQFHGFKAV